MSNKGRDKISRARRGLSIASIGLKVVRSEKHWSSRIVSVTVRSLIEF